MEYSFGWTLINATPLTIFEEPSHSSRLLLRPHHLRVHSSDESYSCDLEADRWSRKVVWMTTNPLAMKRLTALRLEPYSS